jgi:hypothetical protein
MTDVRAEVRRSYIQTYERSGCRETALAEATFIFAILTGGVPLVGTLDELLRGAILGDDHPLMRLLDVPEYGEQVDDGDILPDHPLLRTWLRG